MSQIDKARLRIHSLASTAKERRKEMFYLATHTTLFIYGHMASVI